MSFLGAVWLCLGVLSAAGAGGSPLADRQETTPSPHTEICLQNMTGRYTVTCENFHLELENGNLLDLYKDKASVRDRCVIPNSGICGPCNVTRIDDQGIRHPANYTFGRTERRWGFVLWVAVAAAVVAAAAAVVRILWRLYSKDSAATTESKLADCFPFIPQPGDNRRIAIVHTPDSSVDVTVNLDDIALHLMAGRD